MQDSLKQRWVAPVPKSSGNLFYPVDLNYDGTESDYYSIDFLSAYRTGSVSFGFESTNTARMDETGKTPKFLESVETASLSPNTKT